ncbi:hypothetical protein DES41_106367 [Pseudorhodoferax soli]|uniref:Uncharacterized protein n=1 Tax=Pseudorhodoferax soli TaxID=545864 RepID=A0A368XNF0_9BURK|nr:hypothetical protein DES41_106367 [Pseudorhodoferax soli]
MPVDLALLSNNSFRAMPVKSLAPLIHEVGSSFGVCSDRA